MPLEKNKKTNGKTNFFLYIRYNWSCGSRQVNRRQSFVRCTGNVTLFLLDNSISSWQGWQEPGLGPRTSKWLCITVCAPNPLGSSTNDQTFTKISGLSPVRRPDILPPPCPPRSRWPWFLNVYNRILIMSYWSVFVFIIFKTVRFKNELERNITIKLGYANAKVFLKNNPLLFHHVWGRLYERWQITSAVHQI